MRVNSIRNVYRMFHNYVSLQLWRLEDKRQMTIFTDEKLTTELFNTKNFNDITKKREKGEAKTYAARFMDRVRNYD